MARNQKLNSSCVNSQTLIVRIRQGGQALVEFTLVFIILLVVAWIPADFGLAFYTGQLASNAAREGARIGSALTPPFDANTIQTETCKRLPSALLGNPGTLAGFTSCSPYSNAKVRAQLVAGTGACNQMVRVDVSGSYNFFFYQLLRLVGISVTPDVQTITRQVSMRWEHQC